MSQVSLIRRLCFIFLVSVLETHAETVADALYPIKTLTNSIPGDVNNSSDPLKELSTESVTAVQEEDQDPVESSETIVYNRFEDPQDDDEEDSASEEDPEGPEDHVIPHSEHEEPKDVPTKPKYTAPGEWAKPSKVRDVSSEDVPTRLYAQVRRTHTVKRLPRWKAIQDAETEEEKENAARLREVVRNSKVNTVYTEEGYEDSAYDHAGHVRDADYHEGYARKLHEQLDAKKKANDGEDDPEDGNSAASKLEKIDPEEFKEFDDDYRDRTTTDYSSDYPKAVAESGIQRLQEDLEREVEEIEKGVEINKLEKAEESSDRESLTVSPGDDDYGRKNEKKDRRSRQRAKLKLSGEPSESHDSGESLDESQALRSDDAYMQKYSTTDAPDWMSTQRGAYEATTTAPNFGEISSGLSESYRYDVDGSSGTEGIDFQPVGGSQVTPSYSQVFWDYFKARQNQFTTMESPSILESSTSSPSLLQAPSFVENLSPYTFYGDQVTTQFPIMESATISPQEFVPVQTMDPRYLINNKQSDNQLTGLGGTSLNELWQPVNTHATPTTDNALLPDAYNAKHFNNDHIVPLTGSERNLDSKEESDKNFGNSFFNPPLNSFANRKPRYKVTVRHKPSKPEEPPTSDQGSSTSSPLNNAPNEASSENTRLKDNYMKVLMHLKNEDRNHYPNSFQKNNFFPSKNEDLTYLTRMRPPLPQKDASYYNFDLRGSMKNEFPGFETSSRGHPKLRAVPVRQSPPRNVQSPFNRKRSSMPSGLLPPVPFLGMDYTTFKEASGHVTRGGSPSKPSRGFEPISRIRAKRRERRSTGWESDVVKGVDQSANNGTSNQGEIERAAKNAMIEERNPRRKVTRGLEVGPVPDTSSAMAKQPIEKKSRSHAIDRGGGSRRSLLAGRVAEERESSVVPSDFSKNGGEDESSRGGLEHDSGETQGDIVEEGVRQERKDHEELLKEASGVTNDVIDRQINAGFNNHEDEATNIEIDTIDGKINTRFNNHENKATNSEVVEESVKQKRETHVELLNEAPKTTNDFIDRKMNARFNNHENKAPNSETVKESVKQKRESHEELLNEAPKTTNDFTDRKINPQFNNHENKATNSEIVEESMKQKTKNHEELLNEAPKIANDVVNEEINARFNDNENKSAEVEENGEDVEVEVPDFDYVEELTEEDKSENEATTDTPEAGIDSKKYPFYESLPIPSALKYAMDPRRVPKKTYGKMEFYSSRDAYKHCDEVEPSLKVLPKEEAPAPDGDLKEDLPRLTGLGDKLDCYKAKYFDEDPFDNPLFLEKEVENPVPALDVDTKQFASRIMMFPKEDDDYVVQKSSKSPENHRQPRKLSSTSGRVQKTRRVRYKTYPKARIVTRPRVYRMKGSQVRFVKVRRPRKPVRRPVSSASEVSSFYMPYQNQVYEDVMGTIKNLANSYQVEEVTTVPTSDEDTVTESTVAKKNTSKNSTSTAKKEKDEVIAITDRPGNVRVNIEGLTPPKAFNRHRVAYNRNRNPQRNRTRKQNVQKSSIMRPVRRQKIRIYKRDVAEENGDRVNGTRAVSNTRRRKNINEGKFDLKKEDSNTIRSRHPVSADTSSTDADQKREKSQRVVYTINDRIRHSKPKEELTRAGKFVDEPKEENSRRNEPRYNYIRRRRPLITTETPPLNSTDNTDWTEPTSTISDTTSIIDEDRKENREVQYYTNDTDDRKINSTEDLDGHSDQQTSNVTENSYAVHEDVDEDATTTQKPSTFPSLKSFLEADPPEFSSEELKKSLFPHENDSNANFDDASSKQSNEKEDSSKISHNSYFSDEESAERQETKVKDHPESLEETSSKENESMEDRTFFHYPSSRPSSPADNYEDPKYAELGPRVNKPAFFHPPFRFSSFSRMKTSSEEDSQEAGETGEEKEHVFPWYRDKKDENREKRNPYHGKSIGEYEYPWERRERLARGESRKRESKRKWLSFEDEDDDDTFLKKRRRNAYPRGRYRFWTRKEEDASEEDAPDNVELSSEHRPVKYSSRYSSKNFTLPAGVTSTSVRPTEVEEISRSIKKILEGGSEKKSSKENNSSGEEKKPVKRPGISRGMINPEAITLAPTRRAERKDFVKVTGIVNLLKDEGKKGRGYSNASMKNALENVVLHLAKESPSNVMNSTRESNSTGQLKKRRRRPLKNVVSLVQSTTKSAIEANRSRRRQKSTTPGTVTSTSSSTTSAPRVVKRKQNISQKSVKGARKNIVPEENKLSNSDAKVREASTVRSEVLENSEVKENGGKKSQMGEELTESAKNRTDQELQGTSFEKMGNLKSTTDQGVNGTNESKSEDESEEARKAETSKKLEETLSSVTNDDKRFDFKHDRIDSLSDFVTSDGNIDGDRYDDKNENILKEEGFLPKNTVQLSEQGSREIISTVSWMSENYDF